MSPSTKRILARQRCLEIFRHANITARFSGQWLVIDEMRAREPALQSTFTQALQNMAVDSIRRAKEASQASH
jgi:hypothetical protein